MSHRYAAQAVKQFSCSYNTRPNTAALLSTFCDRNAAMERLTEAYPANTSQEAEQQLAQTASHLNRSPSAQTPPLPSREAITPWQPVPQLISRFRPPHDHVGTLHDNWQASILTHPQVPALGWRETTADGQLGPYHWITYKQVGDLLTALGSGLLHLGLTPGSHIGLYGVNSKEWVLLDAAAHAYSMIPVPLYDTLGPHAVQYICQHAELAAVGCSAAAWPKLKACLPQCPTVRLVVIWGLSDSCSSPHTAQQQCHPSQGQHISASVQYVDHQHSSAIQQHIAAKSGHQVPNHCQVVTMNQLQAVGQHHLHPHVTPEPQDVATICYTSGTTGHPKGAVLTHANLIANAAGNVELQPPWQPGSRHLSYLPLAHIFERKNLIVAVHCGCSIGCYSGDARRLLEDAAALQPHMFMSVPRILNRLHDEALMAAQGVQQKLHHLSDQSTEQQQPASAAGDHDAAGHGLLGLMGDEQLYQSIRNELGGQVQYMTTGASPISSHVLQFLRTAFACPVLEGYGMTETSCTISIQRQDDDSLGHVGQPLPCCEVMLKDVPHLGYFTSDQPYPRGEVCVRGPIIFQGYHKAPELTAQVIDNEGWFHTGDVGCWSTGGNLRLIDRVKNIFKLAQGEYVAPERLEAVYARSPFVQQCFVHGDSYKSQLVAVVVPDAEHLTAWAAQHQMQQGFEALCSKTVAEDAVLHSMVQQGRLEQLQGFELVAAVRLVPQPFTAEEGLVTPTMKLRRHAARDKFATLLQNMYESLERKLGRVDDNGAAAGGDSEVQQAGAAAVPGGVGVARVHARCKL